jgi:SAM-dependent methyltransferase
MTMDWKRYWNSRDRVQDQDPLHHVGKTVQGTAVSLATLDLMVGDIVEALSIIPGDVVLDLCCGNGLLTYRCASFCESVTGIDFSEPLLEVARATYGRSNVTYILADVRRLSDEVLPAGLSKIYMYEALQHFDVEGLVMLLSSLRSSAARMSPIFFGSVPDAERIWFFYDTPERREEYWRRSREGTEPIGHWWNKRDLKNLAESLGYDFELREPDGRLHVVHYRMDVLLTPRSAGR